MTEDRPRRPTSSAHLTSASNMAAAATSSTSGGASASTACTLSATEAVHYDRQLRVWGVAAQQRLSESILLFKTVDGVAMEVLKNLALAGVGKILVALDPQNSVSERDVETNFLLRAEDIGKEKGPCIVSGVQELNPLMKVEKWDQHAGGEDLHVDVVFDGFPTSSATCVVSEVSTAPDRRGAGDPAADAPVVRRPSMATTPTNDVAKTTRPTSPLKMARSSTSSRRGGLLLQDQEKREVQRILESSEECARKRRSHFVLAHSGTQGFCFFKVASWTPAETQEATEGGRGGGASRSAGHATSTSIRCDSSAHHDAYANAACFHQLFEPALRSSERETPASSPSMSRAILEPIKNALAQRFLDEFADILSPSKRQKEQQPGTASEQMTKFSTCFRLPAPLISVSAVLGGVVAQEAIKILTGKDKPLRNLIVSDLETMTCTVEEVGLKTATPACRPIPGGGVRNATTQQAATVVAPSVETLDLPSTSSEDEQQNETKSAGATMNLKRLKHGEDFDVGSRDGERTNETKLESKASLPLNKLRRVSAKSATSAVEEITMTRMKNPEVVELSD